MERRRVVSRTREEGRLTKMEAENEHEHRRAAGAHNKNNVSSFNPITLQYDNTTQDGKDLRRRDEEDRQKANDRAALLQRRSTREAHDIITGLLIQPFIPPSPSPR